MTTARDGTQPRLENWKVYEHYGLKGVWVAEGDIYNDRRWPDGTHIYTSKVMEIEGDLMKTRNTLYKLGVPEVQQ